MEEVTYRSWNVLYQDIFKTRLSCLDSRTSKWMSTSEATELLNQVDKFDHIFYVFKIFYHVGATDEDNDQLNDTGMDGLATSEIQNRGVTSGLTEDLRIGERVIRESFVDTKFMKFYDELHDRIAKFERKIA